MTKGKKRGRPRKPPPLGEIVRELNAMDIWHLNMTRNKGGRPEQALNRELVTGAAARPDGQTLRAFVRGWFRQRYRRDPELDEIIPIERRIRRRRI